MTRYEEDEIAGRGGVGIALGVAAGYIALMIIGAFLLYGCSLEPVSAAAPVVTEETLAAQEARLLMDEYLRIGEIVARANPRLTSSEAYAIGRAVYEYADRYGVGTDIVVAVIVVESSGSPKAVSPRGAVGLMQVMPRWKRELGIDGDLKDIDVNIRIGTFILADNIRRWGRDEGIQRYFWGTSTPDGRYLAKVLGVLEGLDG